MGHSNERWHIDANYESALRPPGGVKTHALLGAVGHRSGGTLIISGSHRAVKKWFKDNPAPPDTPGADMRKRPLSHPYFRDLHTEGDPASRIARFMDRTEVIDGIPLQIVENIGAAGDVLLLHPLTLHVAAANAGSEPRFLLSGGVTTDMWGWADYASRKRK